MVLDMAQCRNAKVIIDKKQTFPTSHKHTKPQKFPIWIRTDTTSVPVFKLFDFFVAQGPKPTDYFISRTVFRGVWYTISLCSFSPKCPTFSRLYRKYHLVPVVGHKPISAILTTNRKQFPKFRFVLHQRSPNFLSEGHKLLHNSSRAGHLTWCDCFEICHILLNQHVFLKHVYYFFILHKIASRAGFCPRAVVWWPSFCTITTMYGRGANRGHRTSVNVSALAQNRIS